MFPNVEFLWSDDRRANGSDPLTTPLDKKWRNQKCDVQATWNEINFKREVFVTSDKNFHDYQAALTAVGANTIAYPGAAVSLI